VCTGERAVCTGELCGNGDLCAAGRSMGSCMALVTCAQGEEACGGWERALQLRVHARPFDCCARLRRTSREFGHFQRTVGQVSKNE